MLVGHGPGQVEGGAGRPGAGRGDLQLAEVGLGQVGEGDVDARARRAVPGQAQAQGAAQREAIGGQAQAQAGQLAGAVARGDDGLAAGGDGGRGAGVGARLDRQRVAPRGGLALGVVPVDVVELVVQLLGALDLDPRAQAVGQPGPPEQSAAKPANLGLAALGRAALGRSLAGQVPDDRRLVRAVEVDAQDAVGVGGPEAGDDAAAGQVGEHRPAVGDADVVAAVVVPAARVGAGGHASLPGGGRRLADERGTDGQSTEGEKGQPTCRAHGRSVARAAGPKAARPRAKRARRGRGQAGRRATGSSSGRTCWAPPRCAGTT